jgi:ribosomal protein L33
MATKKKTKRNVYRFYSQETGEHYTVRLSREAYDKLSAETVKKFSRKLRKHIDFKVIKNKGK